MLYCAQIIVDLWSKRLESLIKVAVNMAITTGITISALQLELELIVKFLPITSGLELEL